jgi:SAM-dependent methyltransferase
LNARELAQGDLNTATWTRRNFLRVYNSQALRPVERVFMQRHASELSGRVLELGCGGGRLTGHLIDVGDAVYGIDVSSHMIEYCRRNYPRGDFRLADLRNLISFDDESFDAVIAVCNVLDVLDDFERRGVLDQIRRLLVPGGLLIMSSHNRAHMKPTPSPMKLNGTSLPGLVQSALYMPRRVLNHRRLAPLEKNEPDYAIRNDETHGFALLHYYISARMQARQLDEQGFELVECLDLDGHGVDASEDAEGCSELHYVARRADRMQRVRTRITDEHRARPQFAGPQNTVPDAPERLKAS